MGRGFLRGVIWGVVAATSTLVLLSQIGPPPGSGRLAMSGPEAAEPVAVVPDAADAPGSAPVAPARVAPEVVADTGAVMPREAAEAPAETSPGAAAPGTEAAAAPAAKVPAATPPLAAAPPAQEPSPVPEAVALAPAIVPEAVETEAVPKPPAPAAALAAAPEVAAPAATAQQVRAAPQVLAVAPEAAAPPASATDAVAPVRAAATRPPAGAPAAPDAPPPGDAGPGATAAAPPLPDAPLQAPHAAAVTPPAAAAPALPAPGGASDRPPAPPRPATVVLAEVAPPAADGPPPPPLTPEEAALAATVPGLPEAPPLVIVEAEEPGLPAVPALAAPEEPPATIVVPADPVPEPAPPVAAAASDPPAVLARPAPLPSAAGLDAVVPGVTTGRLPRIGTAAPATQATDAGAPAADTPPLQRHARPFDNPAAKPAFALVLIDTGEPTLDRAALAALPFPVTFALDPTAPGAGLAATIYRAAGQEVAMLATGIPEGATAADLEQTFAAHAAALPEAVAVMDPEAGGFQGDRALAAQVVPIVKGYGRGVLSWDRGLNAASQVARREGVANGVIFRRLDGEDEGAAIIRRYLDRAAFKAVQDGRVIVAGETRPETVAALLAWAVEGRAATVALAPLSAALTAE